MTERTSLPDMISDMEEHLSNLEHRLRIVGMAVLGEPHDPHDDEGKASLVIYDEVVNAELEFKKLNDLWSKVFEASRPQH